ncbi:iron-sulfur cluster assembly scaffold protein [Deefgea rivuli]|uniref:iron-sulfur cluster assembly scaffold protein n=1 Tax=Deefgea rivuli TaxID=400948 RepID=UPI000489563D|nr:iron-sulfur cluster assembly scaffold protein [Deefgea rivuli]
MFNEIIVKNFSDPAFASELDEANTSIEIGNPVCGDRIRVQLHVTEGLIKLARYQAWGCATSLATGNVFCACINGKQLSVVLNTSNEEIETMLGDLEPSQHHCLEMLRTLFHRLKQFYASAK